MSTILLEIITPERIAYTNEVDMVVAPGILGALGILPKHIPLFSQLVEGEVKIKKGQDIFYLSIGGGFLEVIKNKVMILVTRAVNATELNEQEILSAKRAAELALKQKPAGQAYLSAQAILRQSLFDLKILRRRKQLIH